MLNEWFGRTSRAALVALAAFALAGCGDDEGTGVALESFDANGVVDALESLLDAASPAGEATASIYDIVDQLDAWEDGTTSPAPRATGHGLIVERVTAVARRYVPLLPDVDLGTSLGSTYVLNETGTTWVVDAEATGAPADGIRVTTYATDAQGDIRVPLVPIGYADLIDQDDETAARLSIEVVNTESTPAFTAADLVQSLTVTETGTGVVEQGEVTGVLRSATGDVIEVSITSRVESVEAGADDDLESNLVMSFIGPDASYSWQSQGSEAGASGAFAHEFLLGVNNGGLQTELDLMAEGTIANGLSDGNGTITQGGTLIANVRIQQRYEFTTADGEQYSNSARGVLENTLINLIVGGVLLIEAVPVMFFVPLLV